MCDAIASMFTAPQGEVMHFDDWGVTSADTTSVTPLPDVSSSSSSSSSGMGDWANLGLQIGGAAMQAYGAYQGAEAQQRAYKYSAATASRQAEIQRYQAKDAIERGQHTEAVIGLKAGALKGSQRASLAGRGIDIGEGTPLDILTSTDYMKEVDFGTARRNSQSEAWLHKENAKAYDAESEMYSEAAGNVSPFSSAAGSLLTGAGQVASSWYRWRNVSA